MNKEDVERWVKTACDHLTKQDDRLSCQCDGLRAGFQAGFRRGLEKAQAMSFYELRDAIDQGPT